MSVTQERRTISVGDAGRKSLVPTFNPKVGIEPAHSPGSKERFADRLGITIKEFDEARAYGAIPAPDAPRIFGSAMWKAATINRTVATALGEDFDALTPLEFANAIGVDGKTFNALFVDGKIPFSDTRKNGRDAWSPQLVAQVKQQRQYAANLKRAKHPTKIVGKFHKLAEAIQAKRQTKPKPATAATKAPPAPEKQLRKWQFMDALGVNSAVFEMGRRSGRIPPPAKVEDGKAFWPESVVNAIVTKFRRQPAAK